MEQNIISMREIQRNYKRVLEKAKTRKGPVFLGAHGKAQAVLMDIESFERLEKEKTYKNNIRGWEDLKREFDYLAKQGKQNVNLARFIREDRQTH